MITKDTVDLMDSYEWRILTRLRENRGAAFTAYQIANNNVSATTRSNTERPRGYSASDQLVRKALNNLVTEGYVVKKVKRQGTSRDTYYSAR
jgi:uncharacterized protein YceH (UPF0502 family)